MIHKICDLNPITEAFFMNKMPNSSKVVLHNSALTLDKPLWRFTCFEQVISKFDVSCTSTRYKDSKIHFNLGSRTCKRFDPKSNYCFYHFKFSPQCVAYCLWNSKQENAKAQ